MAMVETHGKNGKPLQHIRMYRIMERIGNGEVLSITELAREWGVTTKTIQRDFDKLMATDAPIERAEDGKRFRKKRPKRVGNDAQLIIGMIDSMARDVGGTFYARAHQLLNRLENHVAAPIYSRVDIEDIGPRFDLIRQLETAIAERRHVAFMYRPWYSEAPKHYEEVAPLRIMLFEGYWYLLTRHAGYYKKFYVKEISNLETGSDTFTVSDTLSERIDSALNIWFDPESEPFEVTLLLDPDIVVYFERKPLGKNQKLYRKSDGSAELVVKISDKEEIFPVLRYWLPDIRILEPEALQKEFEESLEFYLKH